MFVVTLPKSASDPLAFAKKAKSMGADILEIRGDLTPDVEHFDSPIPLIITPRGKRELIEKFEASFIDLDVNKGIDCPEGPKIIRSFHDFDKTPTLEELLIIAQDMSERSEIVKIATTIKSFGDIKILSDLHSKLPSDQKRIILGMGPKAHLTRLLSPLKNQLTYTYLEDGEEAAPGQIKLSMHQLTSHCKEPKMFGLLGDTSIKSLSSLIQNTLFSGNNIDAVYSLFLTENLDDDYNYLTKLGISGFSVTSPFKQSIIPKLDRIDKEVEELGTVNTVVREEEEYVGYARDAYGLIEGYGFLREAKSAAILGSGGAVPSVINACKVSGIERICIYARSKEKRDALSGKFKTQSHDISALKSAKHDVIFCAVSEDIDFELPEPKQNSYAIDLRYNKETKFMSRAKTLGYETHDGLMMLLHQALAQFKLFTGTIPSEASVKSLSDNLSNHGKQ